MQHVLLIAEDHDLMRTCLLSHFQALLPNWVIAGAADGQGAERQAQSCTPQVAIVDLNLPIIGGIEVVRRIMNAVPAIRLRNRWTVPSPAGTLRVEPGRCWGGGKSQAGIYATAQRGILPRCSYEQTQKGR